MQIINRMNARRRAKSLQIEVELEDDIVDDETDTKSEVAIGA